MDASSGVVVVAAVVPAIANAGKQRGQARGQEARERIRDMIFPSRPMHGSPRRAAATVTRHLLAVTRIATELP